MNDKILAAKIRIQKLTVNTLNKAVVNLIDGFVWVDSVKGHEYWEGVYKNLEIQLEVERVRLVSLKRELEDHVRSQS